jgi:arylsulfatase A
MGYGDFSLQNPDSKIPTPQLDQLAREGLRLTDGHSSSGVCTPSRYALLTGRYHWRRGTGIVGSYGQTWFDEGRLTLPEMLRQKGYHTAAIGKWHLGWDWASIRNPDAERLSPEGHDWSQPVPGGPLEVGFDYYFGDDTPNFPPYTWIENDRILIEPTVPFTPHPTPTEAHEAGFFGEGFDCRPGAMVEGWRLDAVMPRVTERAVEWIGEQADNDQPFFLYWSWTSPHTPVVPIEAFQGSTEAGPYGDFVHQSDFHLGQVLSALEDHGLADNTVVIFSSDNGPESIAYDRIRNHDHFSMGELRGLKQDVWEGGHRVPFVIRWPGVIEPGRVSDDLVSQIDIMATIAEIVDYEFAPGEAEDSYNLLPLLQDEAPSPRDTLVHNTWSRAYALRQDDWVLITRKTGALQDVPGWFNQSKGYVPHDQPGELFNLEADMSQHRNLYQKYPEKVEALTQTLQQIRDEGQVR